MKILLVQPNCAREVGEDYLSLQYPVNLGYIAAALKEAGHEVRMLDLNVMDFGILPQIQKSFRPRLVGLTSMTSSIVNAMMIMNEVKSLDNEVITVLGGVHASALPMRTLREMGALDYLVFGEGERTVVELVTCIEAGKAPVGIDGVVFRRGDQITKNQRRELIKDINSIHFPDRSLIPMTLYEKQHVTRGFSRRETRILEIMTSRGCPNDCIFCAGHLNYGRKVRFRSLENVSREINEGIDKYGIVHVSIEDDTFTLKKELVYKLCKYFKERRLTWNCNARVNTVDYNLLSAMKRSGCKKIAFGIESGNPEILKKSKKGITVAQAVMAVREAKRAGIRYVECDFLIGAHVDETLEDVQDSIRLINKLRPDFLAVSIMCPYPGTEIYRLMIERGYLAENPDWAQFSHFGNLKRYERLTHLSSDMMHELQQSIIRRYYSSPKYILSQLRQMRSLAEVKYFVRMGLSFFHHFSPKLIGPGKQPL